MSASTVYRYYIATNGFTYIQDGTEADASLSPYLYRNIAHEIDLYNPRISIENSPVYNSSSLLYCIGNTTVMLHSFRVSR